MRTGARAQVQDLEHRWIRWIRNVKHHHLARGVHRNEQPLAIACDSHQLGPSALCYSREIEYRLSSSFPGVNQIKVIIDHAGRKRAIMLIARDEFHIDGSRPISNLDRSLYAALLKIPHPDAAAKLRVAWHGMQSRRRTDEIASNH